LEGSAAVVIEWRAAGAIHRSYEPFMEDLRTSPERLYHPECHAQQFGVPALLALAAAHDEKVRRGFLELVDEIEDLKAQLEARHPR
jgi:hypothetical protein